VPKGWWLYELNPANFNEDGEETEDLTDLDISYGDDYNYIDLISFANLQISTKDNHLGFDMNAESTEGVDSLAEYMGPFEEFMLEPEDDKTFSLSDSGTVNINGAIFEKRTFKVSREEDDFAILTLTTGVREDYYLTFMVSYWPDNKGAENAIIGAVQKGLKLE
jgi:hypothetical protein